MAALYNKPLGAHGGAGGVAAWPQPGWMKRTMKRSIMMDRAHSRLSWMLVALTLGFTAGVRAQDASDASDNDDPVAARRETESIFPLEAMMRQAAENISRRYNLNPTQREQTQKMLTEEVTRFLDNHEDIWPLIRDLARYQSIGKSPEGEVAQRIGERAAPLIEEIRAAILDGNERWREILTPEQQKLHDWDLQDMEKTFAKMESRFYAMSEGKAEGEPIFPVSDNEGKPPRPPLPPKTYTPEAPDSVAKVQNEDWWDGYVHEFIRRHELTDAQSESALSILRDMKQRARQYRAGKQEEFKQVEDRLRDANQTSDPKLKQTKVRIWMQIQKKLNKPILDMFQELKDRLDVIPTDAQKRKAKTLRPKPQESRRRTPAKKPTEDKTEEQQSAPATEPADNQEKPPATAESQADSAKDAAATPAPADSKADKGDQPAETEKPQAEDQKTKDQ